MNDANGGASANTRLLLSALAERLIYGDGDTFSRQDALDLAALLPALAGVRGWPSGSRTSGCAAPGQAPRQPALRPA